MNFKILKVATRKSRLALFQAQYVCNAIKHYYPHIQTKLIRITTTGDNLLNITENNQIKKGAFIKELEYALLDNQADIAVHSMKDITVPLPKKLILPIFCKRDDPRDAFVSIKYSNIDTLPAGSIIGTSSLRRKSQIRARRPDLVLNDIRGNIDTRIEKLHQNQYDALILAVAGLNRLQLDKYIKVYIDPSDLLPAMGQGVIAVECRAEDNNIISLLSPLYHKETAIRITAERAVTTYLESYCRLPIASYSEIKHNQIWLRALIGLPDGSRIVRAEGMASIIQPQKLGHIIAKDLTRRLKKNI